MQASITRSDEDGIAVLDWSGINGDPGGEPAGRAAPDDFVARCAGLGAALGAALADPAVAGVVIPSLPVAGAHAALIGDPAAAGAAAGRLARAVEVAAKPVVALIEGPLTGPAMAPALAAAVRVAGTDTVVRFPEIALGLVPGGGITQRIARRAGAAAALDLILSGGPHDAAEAQRLGLIEMVTDSARPAAVALARALARALAGEAAGGEAGAPFRAVRDAGLADPAGFLAAVARMRAQPRGRGAQAALAAIDCVEAALLLPPDEGLDFETAAGETLLATPETRALLHLARAEAAAAARAGAAPLPAGPVAIRGGGTLAGGVAAALAGAGVEVILVDPDIAILRRTLERIDALQRAAEEEGRLDAATREVAWDRIKGATGDEALAAAVCGIEMASEAARPMALAALATGLPAGAPILTGTTWGTLDGLGEAAGRPGLVAGLHLMAPIERIAVAELALPGDAARAAREAAVGLAHALGKLPVILTGAEGYVGHRLLAASRRAAVESLLIGATPAAVDAALRDFGFALGPLEVLDRVGLDLVAGAGGPAAAALGPLATRMIEAGRAGRRAGRGFYRWDDGAASGSDDPEFEAVAGALRADWNRHPRPIGAAEICRRCILAMANDGARLLDTGTVATAADIDLVMCAAMGFPRHRGGPMHWADTVSGRAGLMPLRDDLLGFAAVAATLGEAEFWTPAPIWDRLVLEGGRFGAPF